jgi:hypothetical protein
MTKFDVLNAIFDLHITKETLSSSFYFQNNLNSILNFYHQLQI